LKFLLVLSYPDSLLSFRGDLIKALQKSGLVVHIAIPGIEVGDLLYGELEKMNVVVHDISLKRTGLNPLWDLLTLLQLIKLMLKVKPDYLLSYTIKPVVYGMIAAKLSGVKRPFALITGLGYTFTGTPTGLRTVVRSLLKKMYRLALSFTEKVFFQNNDDYNLLISEKILDQSHPVKTVNGSGVDLLKFKVESIPNKISFLLIARLLRNKGVREYVEAARKVKRVYPDVEFVLVGWLDENPDTIPQSELDQWVSDGSISFLGELEDVRESIANCSVYVLPSYREGTPRTVLEAMAMGRAVITTDAPGCRETVVDGENGFLVSVKSVDELEKSMLKFINQPSLAMSMGRRSREIAEEKYDVHKVNAVMLQEMDI